MWSEMLLVSLGAVPAGLALVPDSRIVHQLFPLLGNPTAPSEDPQPGYFWWLSQQAVPWADLCAGLS